MFVFAAAYINLCFFSIEGFLPDFHRAFVFFFDRFFSFTQILLQVLQNGLAADEGFTHVLVIFIQISCLVLLACSRCHKGFRRIGRLSRILPLFIYLIDGGFQLSQLFTGTFNIPRPCTDFQLILR
ncbi:hypothetical protein D3C80_1148550 [compost metagenome]